jgi:hypothetical protein
MPHSTISVKHDQVRDRVIFGSEDGPPKCALPSRARRTVRFAAFKYDPADAFGRLGQLQKFTKVNGASVGRFVPKRRSFTPPISGSAAGSSATRIASDVIVISADPSGKLMPTRTEGSAPPIGPLGISGPAGGTRPRRCMRAAAKQLYLSARVAWVSCPRRTLASSPEPISKRPVSLRRDPSRAPARARLSRLRRNAPASHPGARPPLGGTALRFRP